MEKVDVEMLSFDTLYGYLTTEEYEKVEILISFGGSMYLVDTLLYYVSDQNPGITMADTNKLKEIITLANRIYNSTWSAMFDINTGSLDIEKLIKYSKQSRYCIEAAGGFRVATLNEVDEGLVKLCGDEVVELVDSPVVKLSDEEESFINLFTWAITGKWRYYIKAGFECKFTANGKLDEPEIKYILKISKVLNRMCELFEEGKFYDYVIGKLKGIKKLGIYKYPEYASDEVGPDESITFVINQVDKLMPRYKNIAQKRCARLLESRRKGFIKNFTTEEKIMFRKVYIELKHPELNQQKYIDSERTKETKEFCDRIRQGVADGLLDINDFAVKVVGTLSKYSYRHCSEKQRAIIIGAINRIEACRSVEDTTKKIENAIENSEDSFNKEESESGITKAWLGLEGLSDLLGDGVLEDTDGK